MQSGHRNRKPKIDNISFFKIKWDVSLPTHQRKAQNAPRKGEKPERSSDETGDLDENSLSVFESVLKN